MNSNALKKVVRKYLQQQQNPILGTEDTRLNVLQSQLIKIGSRSALAFWICVGMTVALFVGMAIFTFYGNLANNTDNLELIFTSSGLGISAMIIYMHRLWKSKTSIELLLVLITELDTSRFNRLLDKLIDKF